MIVLVPLIMACTSTPAGIMAMGYGVHVAAGVVGGLLFAHMVLAE